MNTGLNVLPISQILSCSDGIAAAATFRRCSVLREMVCVRMRASQVFLHLRVALGNWRCSLPASPFVISAHGG